VPIEPSESTIGGSCTGLRMEVARATGYIPRMATITFDTLKLARKLEAAGFPQKQAADTAEALADSLGEVSDLATKADLAELKAELKADLRSELNAQLRWMIGTMLVVAVLAVGPRSRSLRLTEELLQSMGRLACFWVRV
jgi:hypothetical protein